MLQLLAPKLGIPIASLSHHAGLPLPGLLRPSGRHAASAAAAAAAESGDASKVPDSAPSTASGVAPCAAGVKVTAMADAPDDPADGDQSEAVELEVEAADDLLGEDEHEEEFDEAAHDTAVDVD